MAVPCSTAARRSEIVEAARGWLGTPYRHQASCMGAGADCLGLIRGVWRETVGTEPEHPPAYTPDWAEARGGERLMAAALRHMKRVLPEDTGPGDVLLFRMIERGPAKHAAILVSPSIEQGTILHAYSGHSVCETRLTPAWTRRLVAAFQFPDRVH